MRARNREMFDAVREHPTSLVIGSRILLVYMIFYSHIRTIITINDQMINDEFDLLGQLDDLRRQDSHERDNYKLQIQELKERCEEKQERVDEERQKFMDFKQQVALNAINTRSGKQITAKVGNSQQKGGN